MDASASQPPAVLARFRDSHRPILIFGPELDDPQMIKQRHAWMGPLPQAGVKDRDIILIEVPAKGPGKAGGTALTDADTDQLRATFRVAADRFAVVLIGRDGGEKERWTDPVSAQEIFGRIDAMPMRQQEVQAKGGGSA